MSDAPDLAVLRIVAEDPLAKPSERMAARAALKEAGHLRRRQCTDCGGRFMPDYPGRWRCKSCRAGELADLVQDERVPLETRQAAALALGGRR